MASRTSPGRSRPGSRWCSLLRTAWKRSRPSVRSTRSDRRTPPPARSRVPDGSRHRPVTAACVRDPFLLPHVEGHPGGTARHAGGAGGPESGSAYGTRSRVRDVRPARQGAQPGGRPRAALLLFGRVPRQVSRAHRMTTESSLRADIVEVGRRMYARGYTASNDGNISVRLGTDRLLMTRKSVCQGFMTPDMMCITDLDGRKLQGDRDPSSEMLMHLEVYRQRP